MPCTGKYELINNYDMVSLEEDNRPKIIKAVKTHPLGREVLMVRATAQISVPLRTVNQVSVSTDINIAVSDPDFADTIMDKEPTYFGEAGIKSEIIEASGLDLPTVIFKTASVAIDLSS